MSLYFASGVMYGIDSDANSNYTSFLNELESESEWRYEFNGEGGHL